jgi:LacI family transcriptional regulator
MIRESSTAESDIRKIAVLVETSNSVRRDMVLGISRYARLNGPWSLHIGTAANGDLVPKMKAWGAHGVISPIPNPTIGKALIGAGLPVVAICLKDEERKPRNPLSQLPNVTFDAAARVAELATEHFLERQIRHFAFVGLEGVGWSERRARAFQNRLEQQGIEPLVFRQAKRPPNQVWEREQKALTDWIRKLPKPVGILACNDERGRMVLDCCQLAGCPVPEAVAVLGVDNDEVFCNISDPPLSSIALGAQDAGFQAAELLDAIMRGKECDVAQVVAEAIGVVTRRSTDVMAVNDSDVAAAMRFIRQRYATPISVSDVADAVLMSRRALEKRFRSVLGRTILDDIQSVRIENAKRMLLETDESVARIAKLSGFATINYFIRFFRQRVGMSPSGFRGKRAG